MVCIVLVGAIHVHRSCRGIHYVSCTMWFFIYRKPSIPVVLGALRIPETNLEPKLLSMPRTMLPFELPTAINIGRGSLLVSLFACLFVWMKPGF